MANNKVAGLNLALNGLFHLAALHAVGAAGVELAALGGISGRGNGAFQNYAVHLGIGVGNRNCREQSLGIGVERIAEDILGLTVLNKIAQIHNADGIGDMLNNAQVVGDEEIGEVTLFLQFLQQVDDLSLDRNVQSGNRLIAYDELRVESQSTGNAYTLALATGELVGIAILVEWLESAVVHNRVDIILELLWGDKIMLADSFAYNLADRKTGRKAGEGVLIDYLHLGTHCAHFLGGKVINLLTVEENFALGLFAGKAENDTTGGGLAAAGFSNETHGGAALELEAYAVNSLYMADGAGDEATLDGEMLLEVFNFKNIFALLFGGVDIFQFFHYCSPSLL